MSDKAIQIVDLSFGYTTKELVINGLNLNVPQGSIYGFLGANGAGKTTTLKMILGLIKSYKGSVSVFDKNIKAQYPSYLKEIGSLIESPSFYGHLSANDNLKIWANYYNADHKRIAEVLDLIDLTQAAKKKTEHFSTGMKQRLGIAAALLHDPKLLILDEPTNGLDPMGIISLRNVLSKLQDQGKTIILSSHILSEVEKMVSHLGILKDGALIFEGAIEELQAQRDKNIEVILQVKDADKVIHLIDFKGKRVISKDCILVKLDSKMQIPQMINKLVENKVNIYEVKQQSNDLESMFLSISKENQT